MTTVTVNSMKEANFLIELFKSTLLKEYVYAVRDEAKNLVHVLGINDTGYLADNIVVERSAKGYECTSKAPYSSSIEYGCFVGMPRARVITEQGSKRLSDLIDGDKVLTHKLNYKKIVMLKHKWNKKIDYVEIKTKRGKTLKVTPNHPLFLKGNRKVNAEKLKVGDILVGLDTKTLWAKRVSKSKKKFYAIQSNRKKTSDSLLNSKKFKFSCQTPEHRKNLSIALKGKKAWNKGIPMTDIAKKKLSKSIIKWWNDNPEKGIKIITALHAGQKVFNTSIELLTEKILKGLKIDYKKQYRFYDIDRKRWFIFDFYLPKTKTVIECNGLYWHSLPEIIKKDKIKKQALEKAGYTLIVLWEKKISEEILCEALKINRY